MSKVYLVPMTTADPSETVNLKLRALWDSAGFSTCFTEHDLAALKLHVGEPGTKTYVDPGIVKVLVDLLDEEGATPFLTD